MPVQFGWRMAFLIWLWYIALTEDTPSIKGMKSSKALSHSVGLATGGALTKGSKKGISSGGEVFLLSQTETTDLSPDGIELLLLLLLLLLLSLLSLLLFGIGNRGVLAAVFELEASLAAAIWLMISS